MPLLLNFSELTKNSVDLAGGKGASLGEMTSAGIPVPPGFVVLAITFEKFLEETDLNVEVAAILDTVDHNVMHTVEQASEKIQGLIKQVQMPVDIAEEVKKEFVKLDAEFVAVRSSATAEDGAENAWAGQLDSYLNTTQDQLLEKVQHCWASLFTPRAIFYRFEKGLHTQKISVAVVVQKMVESEISGIAFSVHPVTEDYNQLIIEAGWGLGESIVSGSITPDSYVVEKNPRNILDINISTQTRGLYRAQNGGNQWQDIAEPQASSQVLTQEQILELSEIILGIEKHYGFPCDIEWAYEAGKFYIVQSRPITTLKELAPENFNLKDSLQFMGNETFYKEITYPFIPVICFESAMRSYLNNPLKDKLHIKEFPKVVEILKDNFAGWNNGKVQAIRDEKEIWFVIEESRHILKKYVKQVDELMALDYAVLEKNEFIDVIRLLDEICTEVYKKYLFYIHEFFETEDEELLGVLPEVRMELSVFVDRIYKICDDIINALAKKFGTISWQVFMYATFEEIIELLENPQNADEFIKIHKRPIAFIFDGKELHVIKDGTKVLEIIAFLQEKKMELGNSGEMIGGMATYKGVAKGHVVRLLESDYKNVEGVLKNKKEYILVTSMTRPEFMPYLKNCMAIVTNEGGITCHAAIVSRELKIPCLVGTKIATQVLQDGDWVEVDADKGIIRIIENMKS
jgi:phosphoenolpyruvate synthase/pyruvate phosphate dikinase